MEERVRIEIEAGVADVRLARPDKMNALDEAMFEGVVAAGERLKTELGLRAVVLSGEGRAFCAGLDMGNFGRMAEGRPEGGSGGGGLERRTHGGANRAQYAALVWRDVPVPVIAAVHGVAFGGGLQVALGADIRLVAPDARLSVLEIKWGLVPDMAGIQLMRTLLRDDVVRELTFTGRILSGPEAVAAGLATRVSEDPRAEALALAREIAGRNPDAIRAAKRLLNAAPFAAPAEILMAESREQTALIGSANQVEAVLSNLQKREPAFTDPVA